jgi:hypothetical protein
VEEGAAEPRVSVSLAATEEGVTVTLATLAIGEEEAAEETE